MDDVIKTIKYKVRQRNSLNQVSKAIEDVSCYMRIKPKLFKKHITIYKEEISVQEIVDKINEKWKRPFTRQTLEDKLRQYDIELTESMTNGKDNVFCEKIQTQLKEKINVLEEELEALVDSDTNK